MVLMTTPTRRFLRRHARAFFKPAARYPADPRAVFILTLSVFSGLTAFIVGATPDTLQSLLPNWGVQTWSALLVIGSAVTLAGMARQTLVGILVEQVGSVMVAVATLFYSTLGFIFIGWDALQIVGIVAAWGVACLVRWIQLQALIADGELRALERLIDREVKFRIQDEG